jgi:hypothetical protein
MEFRGLALVALWTLLSGPVFGPPAGTPVRSREGAAAAATRPAVKHSEKSPEKKHP